MSESVRRILSFFLVLQLVMPCSIFAAAVGEFTSVAGTVTQMRAAKKIKPVKKSPILIKDTIITDQASSAMMAFSDNSTIKLEQNTKLKIDRFLFKKQSRTAVFLLSVGKLTAAVSEFIGGDNVFEVRSPTCALGVRGTGFEFIESRDEDQGKATISCTEGSLALSALSDTGAVVSTALLEAGQMAVIAGGVITISMIGAAAAAGAGAAATTTGASATTAAGWSTGAIVGTTAAAIAGAGAVAVATNGGGSSGGHDDSTPTPSTPYDATGTWAWTQTYGTNTCGEPVEYDFGTVKVEQTGDTFTGLLVEEGISFSGTVSGDTYTFQSAFPEDFGTTTDTTIFTLTSDTTGTYTTDWIWTDGTDSCGGVESGTVSKIK